MTKTKGMKYVSSQPNNNTFATRMPDKREQNPDHEDLNSSQNISTASGVMSIDQLRELMKNPQVASFLKHQLEL